MYYTLFLGVFLVGRVSVDSSVLPVWEVLPPPGRTVFGRDGRVLLLDRCKIYAIFGKRNSILPLRNSTR